MYKITAIGGIACCLFLLLSGCVHFTPPTITIPFPKSTHARAEYSIDLHAVLQQELATLDTLNGCLSTTIVDVAVENVLTGADGISYASALTMIVDAQYTIAGKNAWQDRFTGRVQWYKPAEQQWYEQSFSHARQELCYDVVRQLREKIELWYKTFSNQLPLIGSSQAPI